MANRSFFDNGTNFSILEREVPNIRAAIYHRLYLRLEQFHWQRRITKFVGYLLLAKKRARYIMPVKRGRWLIGWRITVFQIILPLETAPVRLINCWVYTKP